MFGARITQKLYSLCIPPGVTNIYNCSVVVVSSVFLSFLRLMQMLPIFSVLFPLCSQNIIYGRCFKTLKSYSFSQPYPVVLANTHCLSYLFLFCSHCQIGIASSHLCFIYLWIFFPEKKKKTQARTLPSSYFDLPIQSCVL